MSCSEGREGESFGCCSSFSALPCSPAGDVRNGETVSAESHPPSVFSSAANLLLTVGKSLPLVLFPFLALVSFLSLEWQLLG